MTVQPQTFATHRRFDFVYHVVAFLLALAALGVAITLGVRHPSGQTLWNGLASLALLLIFFKAREYPLRAQDRIIRLEEQLRLARVLADPLRGRIQELTEAQLVGLRFAPDAELASLVEAALTEHLDREAIKKRIQNWKPDTFRV
jgi:hypothetical protein